MRARLAKAMLLCSRLKRDVSVQRNRMKFDLERLAKFLSCPVPEEYAEYFAASNPSALERRGFDPKTLCILNLELREVDRDGWTRSRLFLSGDGCGNYYFVSTGKDESKGVMLWSHDPPGIEDQQESLASFLDSATQENPIVQKVQPRGFCIARAETIGESILDPIGLEEWKKVIASYDDMRYAGCRVGKNPFTGEDLHFDAPGLAALNIGSDDEIALDLHWGRIEGKYVASARRRLEALANDLNANPTVRAR